LPWTTVPDAARFEPEQQPTRISTPASSLPEMMLRARAAVPPMTLFEEPAMSVPPTMLTPLPPLPSATRPDASVST
jgi:hypothetical protein